MPMFSICFKYKIQNRKLQYYKYHRMISSSPKISMLVICMLLAVGMSHDEHTDYARYAHPSDTGSSASSFYQQNSYSKISEQNMEQHDYTLAIDPLCARWNNKQCVQCAPRSFMRSGKCWRVSDYCKLFNQFDGKCTACYPGYSLNQQGECLGQKISNGNNNPLCTIWQGNQCIKCSPNSFFNEKGICMQVSPSCKTFSQTNGQCLSCYGGYSLRDGKCLVISNKQLITETSSQYDNNPLCASWSNGNCIKCSPRTFNNKNNICQKISDLCKSYSTEDGGCRSCYDGFILSGVECKPQVMAPVSSNPLCLVWANGQCTKCSHRSYFDRNGLCVQVDPQCKIYSEKQSVCTQCYLGYELVNNKCVIPAPIMTVNAAQINPYCAQFSAKTPQLCLKCVYGSYMQKGLCILVDHNCHTYNGQNGMCQSCYAGYVLLNNQCLKQSSFRQVSSNIKSTPKFILPQNSVKLIGCVSQQTNRCIKCQANYTLFEGSCLKLVMKPSNSNNKKSYTNRFLCLQWTNGSCQLCLQGTRNNQGVCQCHNS